jgi:hypothetical protein
MDGRMHVVGIIRERKEQLVLACCYALKDGDSKRISTTRTIRTAYYARSRLGCDMFDTCTSRCEVSLSLSKCIFLVVFCGAMHSKTVMASE